jgi:ribonuclease R
MSAVITFGPEGDEKSAWFGPTVIHSAQRFTYESAQEVLDGAPHIYRDEVLLAAKIARKLGKERMENGALVLEQEEVKVVVGTDGKVEKIVKKVRTESHTLIEELMLLANKRVAEFLGNGGKPFDPEKVYTQNDPEKGFAVLYRIHEQPSLEKAEDLAFFMRSIGHPLKLRTDGTIDPRALGETLKKFEVGDLKQTALTFVVRSMAKAIYSTKNLGHYGLQFKNYAHFTSPIRRYPDLVIHRLMRMALAGNPAPASTRKVYERIARLCSMSEVRAAEAERESVKLKLTEYMTLHVGETVTGVITGIAEWGIYVKDKATTAEGLIGLRTLSQEPYTLNPKLATLTGDISKKVYRIGDTIRVRIVRADPERRQIDYEVTS